MSKTIMKACSSEGLFSLIGDVIYYNKCNIMAKLSKNEVKLFGCLLLGQGRKEQIICLIWGDGDVLGSDSKYKQLIRRARVKLTRAGFPIDTIMTMTMPMSGVYLNASLELSTSKLNSEGIEFDVASRVMHAFHL